MWMTALRKFTALALALEAAAGAGSHQSYLAGHGQHEITSTFQLSPGRPGELSEETHIVLSHTSDY
jgi:hypothetical protein